ncbi:MAG TPA: cupin domain-containing protein, partial [Opitutus sp.]|nr:cupin domain-containing protein [Opitutus sp.]
MAGIDIFLAALLEALLCDVKIHFEKVLPNAGESFHCRRFEEPTFPAPYHTHPEIELTYIVSSHGRRFVGDSIEQFGPGDLVLIGSNLPHRWASDTPPPKAGRRWATSLVVQFLPDCLGAHFWNQPEFAAIATLLARAQAGLVFP